MEFEDKIKLGYLEYLKLPQATPGGVHREADLYTKGWCYHTGLACLHPHPHRHYTLVEFAYWVGKNPELFERFIQPLLPRQELTYVDRVHWFLQHYYETGMELALLLDQMKTADLDNFPWYDTLVKIPKYVDEL